MLFTGSKRTPNFRSYIRLFDNWLPTAGVNQSNCGSLVLVARLKQTYKLQILDLPILIISYCRNQ